MGPSLLSVGLGSLFCPHTIWVAAGHLQANHPSIPHTYQGLDRTVRRASSWYFNLSCLARHSEVFASSWQAQDGLSQGENWPTNPLTSRGEAVALVATWVLTLMALG